MHALSVCVDVFSREPRAYEDEIQNFFAQYPHIYNTYCSNRAVFAEMIAKILFGGELELLAGSCNWESEELAITSKGVSHLVEQHKVTCTRSPRFISRWILGCMGKVFDWKNCDTIHKNRQSALKRKSAQQSKTSIQQRS